MVPSFTAENFGKRVGDAGSKRSKVLLEDMRLRRHETEEDSEEHLRRNTTMCVLLNECVVPECVPNVLSPLSGREERIDNVRLIQNEVYFPSHFKPRKNKYLKFLMPSYIDSSDS